MVVSICIISYNHEDFITQAINSVLHQKGSFDLEIVIGDDGSTDNTQEIIRKTAKTHSEINFVLLMREKNIGMMPNFIDTLNSCTGDFIAFLEGDDFWIDDQKLAKQIQSFSENNDISGVFTDTLEVNHEGKSLQKFSAYRKALHAKSSGVMRAHQIIEAPLRIVHIGSLMVKKQHFDFPVWFEKVKAGDFIFVVFLLVKGPFYYLNEAMVAYRKHEESVTSSNQGFNKEYYLHLESAFKKLNEATNKVFDLSLKRAILSRKIQYYIFVLSSNSSFVKKISASFGLLINYKRSDYLLKDILWLIRKNLYSK